MSGAISKSREAWKLPGKTKQKRPLVPPLLWVPPVLKELPNADFTSQAPSLDRNIFTSCLPRPLAWAGSSCQTVSLIMGTTIPAVSRNGQCQPPAPAMPLGRPAPRGQWPLCPRGH